tara:strand:+ start:573 stop:818 length:246 start_codon:yes stop_codon:yes gene_type:complete
MASFLKTPYRSAMPNLKQGMKRTEWGEVLYNFENSHVIVADQKLIPRARPSRVSYILRQFLLYIIPPIPPIPVLMLVLLEE